MTYNQAIKKFNYSGRRTLRTIFDYLSHEWNTTLLSEKMAILKDLINDEQSLSNFLEQYITFYAKELFNKEYVVRAIPNSLNMIYSNSNDEEFKELLFTQYLNFMLNSKLYLEYKLDIPLFVRKRENYEDINLNISNLEIEDMIFIKKYNYFNFYNKIAKKYNKENLSLKLLKKFNENIEKNKSKMGLVDETTR